MFLPFSEISNVQNNIKNGSNGEMTIRNNISFYSLFWYAYTRSYCQLMSDNPQIKIIGNSTYAYH